MITKLPIDWNDMEAAFTWQFDEGGHFLDVATGDIIVWLGPEDEERTADDIDGAVAEHRLIPIEPLSSSIRYRWMEEFVDTVGHPGLREDLEEALRRSRPFRGFKDVLEGNYRERERWFAFERERVLEAAREWLHDNGIEASPGEGTGGRGRSR